MISYRFWRCKFQLALPLRVYHPIPSLVTTEVEVSTEIGGGGCWFFSPFFSYFYIFLSEMILFDHIHQHYLFEKSQNIPVIHSYWDCGWIETDTILAFFLFPLCMQCLVGISNKSGNPLNPGWESVRQVSSIHPSIRLLCWEWVHLILYESQSWVREREWTLRVSFFDSCNSVFSLTFSPSLLAFTVEIFIDIRHRPFIQHVHVLHLHHPDFWLPPVILNVYWFFPLYQVSQF